MPQRGCRSTRSRNISNVAPSNRSSPGCSSKPTLTPCESQKSRIGFQRLASSSKAVSTSPAGRWGNGYRNGRGGKAVHDGVVRRMDGDEVALEMGRQLGDDEAVLPQDALDLVTIGLARSRFIEVEETCVPGRDLDARIAVRGGPARHAGERVERRGVAGELGEKDRRPPDRLHRWLHGQT